MRDSDGEAVAVANATADVARGRVDSGSRASLSVGMVSFRPSYDEHTSIL